MITAPLFGRLQRTTHMLFLLFGFQATAQVRKDSGISENVKVLLFNFGGQDARWSLKEEYIPQGWLCLVCGEPAEQQLASNFIRMDRDSYMPDLIAASDCMLAR
ncbi:hypothetical protein BDL97_19G086800 [Sphagnum fallax]|nr:hypothetical protein BDL97_19G086800 [Sphagnum fallax]